MSRLSPDSAASDAPVSGLLHQVEGAWSAIRFVPTAGGIQVRSSERLTNEAVAGWAAQLETPPRIVLPAAAVMARVLPLGHGDEAAIDHLLHDLAADRLGDSAPPHRIATAVVPTADPEESRLGIALTWPEGQHRPLPPGLNPEEVLCVPDSAGLLSLLGRNRPSSPLLWHHAEAGSTAMLLAGHGRMSLRSTNVTGLEEADAMRRFIMESALQAGWNPEEAQAMANASSTKSASHELLQLPDEVVESLNARCGGNVPDNLDHFGVALGCALATSDDFASLTLLRPKLPINEATLTERIIDNLALQSTAAILVIGLICLILFGPLITNGLRYGLLRATSGQLEQSLADAKDIEDRNRLYAQLGRGSLPVTKLLADIASSTPLGVKIENIKLGTGEPVRISGDATTYGQKSAAELIGEMKAMLQSSRVFQNVAVEWKGQTNLGARSFSLTATLGATSLRPSYPIEQDFAAWTHQQRRHNLPTSAEGGPSPRPSLAATWIPGESTAEPPIASPVPNAPTGSGSAMSPPTGGAAASPVASTPSGSGPAPRRPASTTPPADAPRRTESLGGGARPDRSGGSSTASDTGSRSIADAGARSGDLSAEDMGAMPDILTDEQIKALNREETLAKVSEVTNARKRVTPGSDEDVALVDYWKRLFAHLHTIPRNPGK